MPDYKIKVPYSGYSRGYVTYLVEAESEAEAVENVMYSGRELHDSVTRDDRTFEYDDAEAVE
tara:strand:- start:602 stop:787 length:186 start_codon:yes stop_codon:yes gene_type:complete